MKNFEVKMGPVDDELVGGGGSTPENKQHIKLPEIKDFLQEPIEDYSEIISQVGRIEFDESGSTGGAWWQTNHGRMLDDLVYRHDRLSEETLQLFRRAISENILCDLGSAGGRMDYLANAFSAGLYIDVDKFPGGHRSTPIDPTLGRAEIREFREFAFDGKGKLEGVLPEIHVRADILDFVSRLRDSSVNIMINGIDGEIIPSTEYHELLAKELVRVLKDDGLIFGNNSTCLVFLHRMISKDTELQKHFEIIDPKIHNLGVGGVVVIHKKNGDTLSV